MTFHWSPLPFVALPEGAGGDELALNAVLYVMTLSMTGAIGWLASLAWLERER